MICKKLFIYKLYIIIFKFFILKMNFEHEDRCYYNRWLYEDENLH